MVRGMREKLIELLTHENCPLFMVFGDNVEGLADYLIDNGVVLLPVGRTGDYVLWDVMDTQKRLKIRAIIIDDQGIHYDLGYLHPLVDDPNIAGIIKEDFENRDRLSQNNT